MATEAKRIDANTTTYVALTSAHADISFRLVTTGMVRIAFGTVAPAVGFADYFNVTSADGWQQLTGLTANVYCLAESESELVEVIRQ